MTFLGYLRSLLFSRQTGAGFVALLSAYPLRCAVQIAWVAEVALAVGVVPLSLSSLSDATLSINIQYLIFNAGAK